MAVSIFIASIESSTSPAWTSCPALTASVEIDARHRRADCLASPSRLGAAPSSRRLQPVRHGDGARLAVEIEEDAHSPFSLVSVTAW
jgi:hypothetical protein